MKKYKGITKKVYENGDVGIMVRFDYLGITYPVKNFSKLFRNVETIKQGYDKLQEVKLLIRQGKNPFFKSKETLDELWEERLEQKIKSGDWTNNTPKNYKYFYDAHIRDVLGHKKISSIKYQDLKIVINNISNRENGTQNTFKRILRPLFEEAKKMGLVQKNVILEIDTLEEKTGKRKMDKISGMSSLNIVREIYEAIPKYKTKSKLQEEEFKNYFYMILLTAHREGEIRKLTIEDVIFEENKIISPENITKTKEEYHFPLPEECLEYFKSIKEGLLFPTLKRGTIYQMFQRLIGLTNINFYKDKRLTIHDTRRLMLKVMISDCEIDSRLADSCLSHKQSAVLESYLGFREEDITKAFKKYWKIIKSKDTHEKNENFVDEKEFREFQEWKKMVEIKKKTEMKDSSEKLKKNLNHNKTDFDLC